MSGMGGMGGGFNGMGGMPNSPGTQAPRRQAPPVEHILNLSLEELYKGSSKRMRITKKVGTVSVLKNSVPSVFLIPRAHKYYC